MTSSDVGKDTERRVVNYLRANGWPGAERTVRTGYRVANREMPDRGDIDGTPGLCWQIKSLRPYPRMELAIPSWLEQMEQQQRAAKATFGFLVVRRWGTTDVGRWWTFQRLDQAVALVGDDWLKADVGHVPIRMDMAALVGLLHQTGWAGTEPQEATP